MTQSRMIRSANEDVWRLLADLATLRLISFIDEGVEEASLPTQMELTRQVNQVYDSLAAEHEQESRQITDMATATVWESLKNDTW
jgi:hypothetical protein